MTLLWLPEALVEVERLFGFLADKDAQAAERAMNVIASGADTLLEFPEAGRPMNDETGRREFVVPFGAGAYMLRYRIHDEAVVIIRVWHSREARD